MRTSLSFTPFCPVGGGRAKNLRAEVVGRSESEDRSGDRARVEVVDDIFEPFVRVALPGEGCCPLAPHSRLGEGTEGRGAGPVLSCRS